jgi:hypothetical protein
VGRTNGPSSREGVVLGAFISSILLLANIIFLRTLLMNVKGDVSFEALRGVHDVVHDTFKSTCISLSLYDSYDKWNACLEEAIGMQIGAQLRSLFMTILTFGIPSELRMFWDK